MMIRGIGLRGAVAINAITMIGIGPLITIPLVVGMLHGSAAYAAWIVGGLVAACDGLAFAELGSLFPASGGRYVFLREAFGARRWGRMLAFLFAWQIVLSGPLLLASGYIGFAHYAGYLWPPLGSDANLQGMVAAAVGILTLVLLYRRIDVIGAIGVALAGVAVATLGAIILAAARRPNVAQSLAADPHAGFGAAVAAGLGPALVITLYDYYGYGQSCTIGGEILAPAKVLPRSVLIAIGLVGSLYVALQFGVLGVVPWTELVPQTPGGAIPAAANYVASLVVERTWGNTAARVVTIAILATAFASTFGNLLGYSRIPYAAALDGVFLRPFATLDERGRFPRVALLTIGLLALPACFLSLGDVINALTAGLVIVQSLAQLVAVALLRRRGVRAPYRMWLYPLPALVAFAGWVYIFCSSGTNAIVFGFLSLGLGVITFLWRARRAAEWPFTRPVVTIASALIAVCGVSFGPLRASASPAASATATPVPPHTAPAWGHAAIVERDGESIFTVDGKPFFLYGAAFFYERLPRAQWKPSMLALRALGINTLDLYVPWNWHELADGDFDFDGRTSPRRDLHAVLQLARALDFRIVLRPGPVVRNEWRNGGYPAWLLARPEYEMPLHDILEGRYPATATLQNAHSDDAAAQWMRNATHVRYATRWLQRVLRECAPVADRILAVALDDDQAAYIDNQTYPAPNLQRYLELLRDIVREATAPNVLTFINTYQMKVTASSPVWAMGNWYQSDAYAIGEHDRAQLEFSTGLLHTRPHQPLMASEFQAGWLEGPDDVRPRPADPSNTELAMTTMLGLGVRGIVNFPAQDTLDPAGWEAPFANAFYAWDAALGLSGSRSPRAAPTAKIGALVRVFGPQLAAARPQYDAVIAYAGASYPLATLTNDTYGAIAARTIAAQQACRAAGLACALVDPHALDVRALARYPVLIVPHEASEPRSDLAPDVTATLAAYRSAGGTLVEGAPDATTLRRAMRDAHRTPVVTGITGATFATDTSGTLDGFLMVPNYDDRPLAVRAGIVTTAHGRTILPPFVVPAHRAVVAPLGVRLGQLSPAYRRDERLAFTDCMPRYVVGTGGVALAFDASDAPDGAACILETVSRGIRSRRRIRIAPDLVVPVLPRAPAVLAPVAVRTTTELGPSVPVRNDARLAIPDSFAPVPSGVRAYARDVFADGTDAVVLDNGLVRVVVAPQAGARAFIFEDDATGRNVFTSVGALRDDVVLEPPLSKTDRIAKYTHQFPAGTFNRPYVTSDLRSAATVASATFAYDAPDVVPSGARFTRTLALHAGARAFEAVVHAEVRGAATLPQQRAVSVTSLSVGDGTDMSTRHLLTSQDLPFTADTSRRVERENAVGFYDDATHELATIAWRAGDVEEAALLERHFSLVARLTLARPDGRDGAHLRFGYERAPTLPAARELVRAAGLAAQALPATQGAYSAPRMSPEASGKWRNGLRDRLKSD